MSPSENCEERAKEMRQRKKFLAAEAVLLAVSILEAYQIEVSPDGSGWYSFDSIYYEH